MSVLSKDGSVSIDSEQIRFNTTAKDMTITHTINRTTGSLDIEAKANEKIVARMTGSCERVQSVKKF
jgi:hypothetical protein